MQPGLDLESKQPSKERRLQPTLLLVYTHYHDNFIPAYADELLDGSDTAAREFREQDHPLDIIVFELDDISSYEIEFS